MTVTRSPTAHTMSGAEMAGPGRSFTMTRSFLFLLPRSAAWGTASLGFCSAVIFARETGRDGEAQAVQTHTLLCNRICATISPRRSASHSAAAREPGAAAFGRWKALGRPRCLGPRALPREQPCGTEPGRADVPSGTQSPARPSHTPILLPPKWAPSPEALWGWDSPQRFWDSQCRRPNPPWPPPGPTPQDHDHGLL